MLVRLWLLQALRHNYRQKNVHGNALKKTGVATHLSFFSFLTSYKEVFYFYVYSSDLSDKRFLYGADPGL